MLYTGKGDDGTSGLFGTKNRFPKNAPIYDALGTLDELNSLLGVCRAHALALKKNGRLVMEELMIVQEHLFIVQAQLAGAEKEMKPDAVEAMEKTIRGIDTMIGGRRTFAVPGATGLSGFLDYARAVSRRAERAAIAAAKTRELPTESKRFLNRLSSLLYALARYTALRAGVKEPAPSY